MASKLMRKLGELKGLLMAAVFLLGVGALASQVTAVTPGPGTSISASSDPTQGNPFEVEKNQSSTLTYQLTFSVGPNSEGKTPSVNSISVVFTAENGAVFANGKTTQTEILTSNFNSPMTVQCSASAPADGFCTVTCQATMALSDGTSTPSNTADDLFEVADMTVDIGGPEYVIVDNSNPYDNSPPISEYSCTVQGDPDPSELTYDWILSANINLLTSWSDYQPSTINTDGAGPAGGGTVTCYVFDGGPSQTGTKQVTVHDEYVIGPASPTPTYTDDGYGIGQLISATNPPATNCAGFVGQQKSGQIDCPEGFNLGVPSGVQTLIETTYGYPTTSSAVVNYDIPFNNTWAAVQIPANTTIEVYGWIVMEQTSGTWQVWDTSGEQASGQWWFQQPEMIQNLTGYGVPWYTTTLEQSQ